MVEFLTLFLGLVSGPQMVELAVDETVARVELRLDGETVGTASAPPYRFRVELGDELLPHVLEAIAYDDVGIEMARSDQPVNLPQPQMALRIVLAGRTESGGRRGILVWRAVAADPPVRIDLTLDGNPLPVTGGRHFEMPPVGEGVHVLTAEIELAGGATATANLLAGGSYGERVTAQLTAVPIRLAAGRELPALPALQGWLRAGGAASLEVLAVEERRGTVVVVRDRGAYAYLAGSADRFREPRHRGVGLLGGDRTIRLLDPVEAAADVTSTASSFPLSQPFTSGHGGVPIVLATFHRDDDPVRRRIAPRRLPPQRLADAVAAAGLVAAGSQAPRAVVLVLGPGPADASQWSVANARRFLDALHVPLFVWTPVPPARRGDPATTAAWGDAADVSNEPLLLAAVGDLVRELDRQHVLWVPGTLLPQTIALTPAAQGAELAR